MFQTACFESTIMKIVLLFSNVLKTPVNILFPRISYSKALQKRGNFVQEVGKNLKFKQFTFADLLIVYHV